MRKIEQAMKYCINTRTQKTIGNTSILVGEFVTGPVIITLHDNVIGGVKFNGEVWCNYDTFKAWPTRTTASRLRALGIDARLIKGNAAINGVIL